MKKTYSITISNDKKPFTYRVKPPLARGSYMQTILEPEAYDKDSKEEWSAQLRWPVDSEEVQAWAADMIALFKIIIADTWGADNVDIILKSPQTRLPLRNGNNETNPEYHGTLFMNVRNKFRRPWILGPNGKQLPEALITPDEIYSGAWYRSGLSFYGFEQKGKGIGGGIETLMKIRDDDRLDGGITQAAAVEDFAEFADETAGIDNMPETILGTGGEGGASPVEAPGDFDFLK